jgi:hypothetical protein
MKAELVGLHSRLAPAGRGGGAVTRRLHVQLRRSTGGTAQHFPLRRHEMVLATSKIEEYDRFVKTFATKGAEKRRQHGCKGSTVFRDPSEDDRVWVVFDWDAEGWQSFVSDPEVPAIFQEAGLKGKPQAAELGPEYGA